MGRRLLITSILGFVAAASLFAACAGTLVLARAVIDADGDPQALETKLRRYTDGAVVARPAGLTFVRSRYPVARCFGIVAALGVAALTASALLWRTLRPSKRAFRNGMLALAGSLVLVTVGFTTMKPYQRERIRIIFNPERDPLGSGFSVGPGRREELLPASEIIAAAGVVGALAVAVICLTDRSERSARRLRRE